MFRQWFGGYCLVVTMVSAGAGAAQVRVSTELCGGDGTPISVVRVGQDFVVRILAQDVRAAPTGLRGWGLDLGWNPSVIQSVGPLDGDLLNGDEKLLGMVSAAIWGGPSAGARIGEGRIKTLVGSQAPPGTEPLGAGGPVVLCSLWFKALAVGDAALAVDVCDVGFVGGGRAMSAEDCETRIAPVTVRPGASGPGQAIESGQRAETAEATRRSSDLGGGWCGLGMVEAMPLLVLGLFGIGAGGRLRKTVGLAAFGLVVLLGGMQAHAVDKVAVSSGLENMSGSPIPAVTLGQQFRVRIYAQDVRSSATGLRGWSLGLRGWILDLSWDSTVIHSDDPLDADPLNSDEKSLGIIDELVWAGPSAGAKPDDSTINMLTGSQGPPATDPYGATSPVLLCTLKFSALQVGVGSFGLTPSLFGFVGGGVAASDEYNLNGLATITVVGSVVAEAGPSKMIGQGDSVTLDGSASGGLGPYSYLWVPASGLDSQTAAQPAASPAATTTYTVTVTDDLGQTDSDSVTVTVVPPVVADAGQDKVMAQGDSTLLDGSASGGLTPYSYSWSPTSGLDNPGIAQPTASPTSTTTYTLTVTDDLGQVDTDDVIVTVAPPVVSSAGADKAIVRGDSAILEGSASGGRLPYSYGWLPVTGLNDPNIAQPTASPTATTVYLLTVTDDLGQVASDSVRVIVVDPLDADAGPDDTIAQGGSTILAGSASGGFGPYDYQWSPSTGLDNPNAAQPTASPGQTTVYTLTVTDEDGNTDFDTVTVTVVPPVVVSAGADQMIRPGESVVLDGSVTGGVGPYEYLWVPATGLDDSTVPQPTASPTGTTVYILTVTDDLDQSDQDTTTVTVTNVADFDYDGHVFMQDYYILVDEWGGSNALCDLDSDGMVFLGDYFIFLDNWGWQLP